MTDVELLLAQGAADIDHGRRIRAFGRELRALARERRLHAVRAHRWHIVGGSDKDDGRRRAAQPTALERTMAFLSSRRGKSFCARCIGEQIATRRPYLLVAMLEGHRGYRVRHHTCSNCSESRLVVSAVQSDSRHHDAPVGDGGSPGDEGEQSVRASGQD